MEYAKTKLGAYAKAWKNGIRHMWTSSNKYEKLAVPLMVFQTPADTAIHFVANARKMKKTENGYEVPELYLFFEDF